ncbi:four-carbon acid sugar kinase family protein [Flindersiella endophytica]
MTHVAVVADDLTGAADAGVGFLRAGLSATVTWTGDLPVDRPDVLAIDTATRRLDAEQAAATCGHVVAGLRAAGVPTLYKKIDSTLRGQVGAEVAVALDAWHEGAAAIVAPAFPATGRTTIGGRQYVNGADLGPVTDLLRRAGLKTALATLEDVRAGSLDRLLASGARAVVLDAETDDDLRTIAEAGARTDAPVVWAGSAGLAHHLPPVLGLAGNAPEPSPAAHLAPGPALIAVGSVSPIARKQAADLVASGVVHIGIPVPVLAGTDRSAWTSLALRISGLLGRGRDVVVTIDAEGREGVDDERLTQALGQLVRPCADQAGALIATGGDTAAGILSAWDITALRLVDELEPGVPLSAGVRSEREIPVVTKAGAFGDTGTLTTARAKLRKITEGAR